MTAGRSKGTWRFVCGHNKGPQQYVLICERHVLKVRTMKRWVHIILACLLVLQPTTLLWASDIECDTATMSTMTDGDSSQPCCEDDTDSCDISACFALCQIGCVSLFSIHPDLGVFNQPSQSERYLSATVHTPAGSDGPALPPPISS